MILGDLIKQFRKEHGYSMDTFAQKSGLSKAYISILERNVNPVNGKPVIPSLETIKAVSQTIGIDFNDVIAMLDGNQQVSLETSAQADLTSTSPLSLTAPQSDLLAVFDELNEEGQEKVITYAEDLNRTGYYKKERADGVATKEA